MEQAAQIIDQLADAGVEVYLAEDKLKARALKGGLAPEYLSLIKAHKPQIIAYLSEQNTTAQLSKRPPIQAAPRGQGDLPASYAQQRLWFIDQMDGGSSHYNMPSAMRLQGDFKVGVANQVLQQIIQRHEVLRTVFANGESGPVQIIQPTVDFSITTTDLSQLSDTAQQAAIQSAIKADANQPFDLSRDLMLRVTYLQQNTSTGVLLFNMHHIASDGWSMAVLVAEFVQLYQALVTGRANPLPPLPVQYADYAQWQRDWLQGGVLEQQLQYWQQQLDDLPQVHQLPLDHERPAVQSFRGAAHSFTIDPETLSRLKALARSEQCTLFMLMHAAFSIVIARHANHHDVVIGTPVANRLQPELQPLIGFFVNTLVLRTDCSNNPSFSDYLQQVKTTHLAAQSNQDVPFEHLVDRLNPERSTSHHALFQIMFSMNTNEQHEMDLPGVSLSPVVDSGEVTAKFDLALLATETDGTLLGRFEYGSDLFQPSTIQRLTDSLLRLLDGVLADPQQAIKSLPLLSDTETHHLLYELNSTQVSLPSATCLHQLFEAQVTRTPEHVAVTDEQQSLSYQQLNVQANQVAHHLIGQGVEPDQIIGLCMSRSVHMVMGLMAIMKAGAAYLPLDPSLPPGRLSHMIKDAKLSCVLTVTETAKLIEPLVNTTNDLLCLDGEGWASEASKCAVDNPVISGLKPQHLAYIIYTSGSTGLPKGVMIEHRSAVNSLQARLHHYSAAVDSFLLISPIAFDSSVAGLMWSLCSGAQLVIPSQAAITDPDALSALIQQHNISHTLMTPALYAALLGMGSNQQLKSLQVVIVAGEAFAESLPAWHHQLLPQTQLFNEYGPTEGSVWSTATELQANQETPSSIGTAISNVRLYVLDADRSLLPTGSVGELYIAGDGLARGYLHQDDLTREKFISHQFNSELTERLYQTGDLVRYLENGELLFVGRVDAQVKIRGFRIELSEIEQQLAAHAEVSQSLVMVDDSSNPRLVAYYSTASEADEATLSNNIMNHLKLHLPDYMLPSALVQLGSWPLTANGKVDRKALPQPNDHDAEQYEAPVGSTATQLASIWAELLDISVEQVGAQDHFFRLGGHSLLAIRLLAAIRTTFDCELSVRLIFAHPKLSDMAAQIEQGAVSKHTALQPIDRQARYFKPSFAQQRLWLIDQMDGGSAHYNMCSAMRLQGDFDLDIATAVWRDIIQRHEVLRTVLVAHETGPLQVIQDDFDFQVATHDLQHLNPQQQSTQIEQFVNREAMQPFDLSQDLMLRVNHLALDDQSAVWVINLHHIAADGWSFGVLISEFMQLYQAKLNGESLNLAPLAIQYVDYAHWQQDWLSGQMLADQLRYWQQQLADLPPVHSLPLDHERPQVQSHQGASHSFQLDSRLYQRLLRLAEQQNATLFMVLHAAFSVLLARWSNHSDVVLGTPVANRPHSELEPMIGFFVNTLVLRVDCQNNPSFAELLQRVKQVNLDAQANQDLPFEYLVDQLNPSRSTSHHALFQIMLNMNTAVNQHFELPGVTVTPVAKDRVVAKFELLLQAFPPPTNEQSADMELVFEYNTDLFQAETIDKLASSLMRILTAVSQDVNLKTAELPILSAAEIQHQLQQLNDTAADYPHTACLQLLFEQQVTQHPDQAAVSYGQQTLSHAELNRQANQLAHFLLEQGVQPGDFVGICMSRSSDVVVAILGILKAGGAYLPLDPEYPAERINHMLQDSALNWVVTQQAWAHITQGAGRQQVSLDSSDWQQTASNYQDHNPEVDQLSAHHLAYAIYTSGSTGVPKGVVIEHHQVLNNLQHFANVAPCQRHFNASWWTSLNFDVSVLEIFSSLLFGGHLMIPDDDLRLQPAAYFDWLASNHMHSVYLPPFYLSELHQWLTTGKQLSLQRLVVGVEPIDTQLLRDIEAALPDEATILNGYGPTEATVCCTLFNLKADQSQPASGPIPIGRPMQNCRIYVLDPHLNLLPLGSVGELYIGGVGVSRGYLNQAALTAEKFIQNPFSQTPDRLYKSGDLVRYRTDGQLEFIGRTDHQIKIRGYRVELQEIEHCLAVHPAVKRSLVIAHKNKQGQKLVAYFTSDTDTETDALVEAIRSALTQQLPDYMLPSLFIRLTEFPLTPNDKIDRQRLPQPDEQSDNQAHIEPSGDMETELAKIWAELLEIPVSKVSATAHFFELGGHSLLAIRLLAAIRSTFAVELDVRDLFAQPSLRALAQQLESSAADHAIRPSITAVPRNGQPMPLSFAQQRLWFIDQMDGGSAHYNMPFAMRLHGHFELSAATTALRHIIQRHESLRTTFTNSATGAVQIIHPHFDFEIQQQNLNKLSPQQQTQAVQQAVSQDAGQAFDLQSDLLLRARYLRLGDADGVLLFNLHHIAADGWSMSVLTQEFRQLYAAELAGTVAPLPPLPVQYADYAQWQNNWLQDQVLDTQLSYWQQQLAGVPELHGLSLDYERPAYQTFVGASQEFAVDAPTLTALRALGREHQVTDFMLLHAAFAILIARYSNREDVVIGTPVANRTQQELEPLIGFFVNTLVLRTACTDGLSLTEFLQQIKTCDLAAQANQELPFEWLVDHLNPTRSTAHTPLFQIMLNVENESAEPMELPGVTISPVSNKQQTIKFDLVLHARVSDGGIHVSLQYNTTLFKAGTIKSMADSLQLLLQGMATHTEQNIYKLPLLSPADRQQLQYERNQTQRDYPKHLCIHQLFEQQVLQTPEQVALVEYDQTISYAALNQRANQLSHYLLNHGVQSGDLIGLCSQRSITMMVAVIAIMKTGAAYLPLDPNQPPQRLQHMVSDGEIELLLVTADCAAMTDQLTASTLVLDNPSTQATLADCAKHNLQAGQHQSSQAAYVIYTSGSTGLPKGVVNSHQALNNLCHWHAAAYQLNTNSRATHLASIGFDAAVWEVWPYLISGGQVHLIPDSVRATPGTLVAYIKQHGITHCFLPTALLDAAFADFDTPETRSLAYLLTGGEKLTRNGFQQARTTLVNHYGPTEAAVVTTQYQLNEASDHAPPIGQPIANVRTYVMTPQQTLAPPGVVGELYIAGDGLANGYLNQAELNAERFIQHRFADGHSERLYRTGDLVRYLADDQLAFVGRTDDQVKIRGFRIELGEVTHSLQALAPVRTCVVAVESNRQGEQSLAAYLTLVPEQQASKHIIKQIKTELQQSLPKYMIPSSFTLLDELPLTPNGKVDLGVLSALDKQPDNVQHLAAANAQEQLLLDTLAETLDIPADSFGMDANFFDLGGHSLSLLKVINDLAEHGLKLSIKAFYECETLQQICAPQQHSGDSCLIRLNHCEQGSPLYLVHPMGGRVDCYQPLAQLLAADCPLYGIQAPFVVGQDLAFNDLKALAAHYAKAIQKQQPSGPYRLGGWSIGGLLAQQVAAHLHAAGREITHFIGIDSFMHMPMLGKTSDTEALQAVLAFVRGESELDLSCLPDGFAALNSEQQLQAAARLLPVEQHSSDLAMTRNGLRFGMRLLGNKPTLTPLQINGHAQLFIANENPDQSLIKQGWQQAFAGEKRYAVVPGQHLHILEGEALQQIAEGIRQTCSLDQVL